MCKHEMNTFMFGFTQFTDVDYGTLDYRENYDKDVKITCAIQ